ncbi:hypothetical protein B7L09_04965 [Pseudomonas mandelii]|nr:hypothetical protein B7L09_04965 [Pseudomonas mandelii]
MQIQIIYTQTGMLLSKHPYPSWREVQNQYPDYVTSLGPWDADAIIEYLADEYPELLPHPKEQVVLFPVVTSKPRLGTSRSSVYRQLFADLCPS